MVNDRGCFLVKSKLSPRLWNFALHSHRDLAANSALFVDSTCWKQRQKTDGEVMRKRKKKKRKEKEKSKARDKKKRKKRGNDRSLTALM